MEMNLSGSQSLCLWNLLLKQPRLLKSESEEVYHVEGSEDDSYDEEMAFIFKRFKYLAKKNKIFYGRSSGFRGSISKEKKADYKWCFNYKKPGHFIVDCPEVQKDK